MDKREFARKLNTAYEELMRAADDLAAQVRSGALDADEAARRLAEYRVQVAERYNLGNPHACGDLSFARLLLDQRLPGFQGLSLERHLPQGGVK